MQIRTLAVALATTFAALPAAAADVNWYLPIGTLGYGAGAAVGVTSNLDVRVEYATAKTKQTRQESGVDYDANVKLSNLSLLADWYFGDTSGFRLSAGGVYAKNKVTVRGKPSTTGTIELNGVTYVVPSNASVDGEVDLASGLKPYLGLGWSRRASQAKGFGMRADVGVFYAKPNVTLTATNVPGLNPADLAAEQRDLQSTVDKYRFYPVLSLSLSYAF
jgi:hypothetical protein